MIIYLITPIFSLDRLFSYRVRFNRVDVVIPHISLHLFKFKELVSLNKVVTSVGDDF